MAPGLQSSQLFHLEHVAVRSRTLRCTPETGTAVRIKSAGDFDLDDIEETDE
jgi:hypothetical protein